MSGVGRIGEEYWEWVLRNQPQYATFLGDHRYNAQLPRIGAEDIELQRSELAAFLKRLKGIDPRTLSGSDGVSRDILIFTIGAAIREIDFGFHLWSVDQMAGPQVWLAELMNYHPLRDEKDVRDLLARFRAFPEYIDRYIANLKEGISVGRVAPKVAVARVVGQLKGLLSVAPERSPFALPVGGLPADAKPLGGAVLAAIRDDLYRAYVKLLAYLEGDYLAAARDQDGVWATRGGSEAYAFRARYHTTTGLAPDRIHEIGLEEMRSISAEMRRTAAKLGKGGDLPSFLAKVKADRSNRWPTGREIVAHFERILAKATAALPEWFGTVPKTPCIVKRIEAYRERDCPAAYYCQPPEDLSRPGIFYVNTHEPAKRLKMNNAALAIHEAVPGHHLQMAISCERRSLPAWRRNVSFTAFVEGWALYSERLGDEMGLYEDDLERFGMLTYQAWRACRLVVDTGLHAKRWTRKMAIEFFRSHVALSEMEIVNEVDRYIVWPGQALSYMIGQREISRLRAQAQRKMGARFDIRRFHDVVLRDGALPLSILGRNVRRWAEKEKP
ncbi:MAG: DUF885 domain-containing protein [Elusimicrobia bacterium]|nr:DUF885 domain-containing protein [Elusimicrobiota bacterium]